MKKTLVFALLAIAAISSADLSISIGIRETGATGAWGSNGGTGGGIEWVNLDGQTLVTDGTWQTFTFNFQSDLLTAFAGSTANGAYDGTTGTLEHIRIVNTGGHTEAMTLWIDDIMTTEPTGAMTTWGDFESFSAGDEAVFQEAGFSGSTAGNVLAGSTSAVDDTVSASGLNSSRQDFQFVDGTTSRWIRLTTFNTPNQPNPLIDFSDGSSLSFKMRSADPVPEPATMTILGLGALVAAARKRRK
ncbi:MAG: PEP-CTERM sorting domain-containing protein [Armatimonadetes bacterium]|nr:PEP-CTERM sorting domain-containing protein [Armatimonadota bacterium]